MGRVSAQCGFQILERIHVVSKNQPMQDCIECQHRACFGTTISRLLLVDCPTKGTQEGFLPLPCEDLLASSTDACIFSSSCFLAYFMLLKDTICYMTPQCGV